MLTIAAKPQDSNTVLAEFEAVLWVVKRLLYSSTSSLLTYSMDLGIIGSLFYTETQCSSSAMRWEALALLKHPRIPHREGIWDVELSIRLAQRIVEVGEELIYKIKQEREREGKLDIKSGLKSEEDQVEFPSWALRKVKLALQYPVDFKAPKMDSSDKRALGLLVSPRRARGV